MKFLLDVNASGAVAEWLSPKVHDIAEVASRNDRLQDPDHCAPRACDERNLRPSGQNSSSLSRENWIKRLEAERQQKWFRDHKTHSQSIGPSRLSKIFAEIPAIGAMATESIWDIPFTRYHLAYPKMKSGQLSRAEI